MLTAIRVRKYRGAHILIINKWQNFIAIIFYKGQVHQTELDAEIKGQHDYTAKQYAIACDAMLCEAKKVVDAIREQRSLRFKFKKYASHFRLSSRLQKGAAEGQQS